MKITRVPIIAVIATLAALLTAVGSLSQRQLAQHHPMSKPPVDKQDADKTDRFDADGLEFERKLVKNAPFSATLIIETVHSSADGSSRTRTATSLIYRDAKGRTRRDRMPIQTSSAEPVRDPQPEITTITDPVAGFTYALEHRPRLYRRAVFHSSPESGSSDSRIVMTPAATAEAQAGNSQVLPMPMSGGSRQALKTSRAISSSEIKNEQLGDREIEGVKAEGTRISTSVPAGAIGNEQAMEIIVERWYSPELETPVLIKRSDPRFGETVYRLTNIKRGDPPATLFSVPSEYKVTDEAAKEKSQRN